MSFEEQVMSKDKYLSIFSKSNGGYCVYYPSNIFRNSGAGSASLSYVNHVKSSQLASKIHTSQYSDFGSVESMCLRKTYTDT